MKAVAGITIWMNKETTDFVIGIEAKNKQFGGWQIVGDHVNVSANEMKENGLELVMRLLIESQSRDTEGGSELQRMTRPQKSQFFKKHKNVGITLLDTSEIRLQALRKGRGLGGYIGEPEGRQVLHPPFTHEEFYKALMQAFSISD